MPIAGGIAPLHTIYNAEIVKIYLMIRKNTIFWQNIQKYGKTFSKSAAFSSPFLSDVVLTCLNGCVYQEGDGWFFMAAIAAAMDLCRARAPYCWIMPSVFTTQILSFSSL